MQRSELRESWKLPEACHLIMYSGCVLLWNRAARRARQQGKQEARKVSPNNGMHPTANQLYSHR